MTCSEEKFFNDEPPKTRAHYIIRGIKITVVVGAIALWGFAIYKGYEQVDRKESVYEEYRSNCQLHLQRAGNTGTIAIARDELALAMPWLQNNHVLYTFTFEYQDLKANLKYLQLVDSNSPVPNSINNSIQKNSETIDQIQQAKMIGVYFIPSLIIFAPLYLYVFIRIAQLLSFICEQ